MSLQILTFNTITLNLILEMSKLKEPYMIVTSFANLKSGNSINKIFHLDILHAHLLLNNILELMRNVGSHHI
jgi:hypothetical protein